MLNTQTRFERLAFSGYGARGSQSLVGGRGNRAGHCGGAGAAYLTQECGMDVAMPPWGAVGRYRRLRRLKAGGDARAPESKLVRIVGRLAVGGDVGRADVPSPRLPR